MAGEANPFEERLPWLEKIDDEGPQSGGSWFRNPLGFLSAAAVLVAVLALVLFLLPRAAPSPDPAGADGNLAELSANQSVVAAGEPVQPKPAHPVTERKRRAAAEVPGSIRRASGPGSVGSARSTRPTAVVHSAQAARSKPSGSRTAISENAPVQRVQLGAYGSRAAAERAWREAGADRRLRGSRHGVERASVGGRVFYRLRVEVPAARGSCRALGLRPRGCFPVGRKG